jgi:hypothetical protein
VDALKPRKSTTSSSAVSRRLPEQRGAARLLDRLCRDFSADQMVKELHDLEHKVTRSRMPFTRH